MTPNTGKRRACIECGKVRAVDWQGVCTACANYLERDAPKITFTKDSPFPGDRALCVNGLRTPWFVRKERFGDHQYVVYGAGMLPPKGLRTFAIAAPFGYYHTLSEAKARALELNLPPCAEHVDAETVLQTPEVTYALERASSALMTGNRLKAEHWTRLANLHAEERGLGREVYILQAPEVTAGGVLVRQVCIAGCEDTPPKQVHLLEVEE